MSLMDIVQYECTCRGGNQLELLHAFCVSTSAECYFVGIPAVPFVERSGDRTMV